MREQPLAFLNSIYEVDKKQSQTSESANDCARKSARMSMRAYKAKQAIQDKHPRQVWRMTTTTLTKALTIIILAVTLCTAALLGCTAASEFGNSNIIDIQVQQNTVGATETTAGVAYPVYRVVISNDCDWNNLSTEARAEITNAAITKCREMAKASNSNDYDILGESEGTQDQSPQSLFSYDAANDQVIIKINGNPDGNPQPAPAV